MLRRRMLIMLAIVLLIVLILGGYKAFSIYQQIQMFTAPKPPVSVAAATAEQRPWQQRLPAVGSLKALQGVELSLEQAGTVKSLHFESGQQVKQGQLLLQLDSDQEAALLGTAQADLGLAKVDYGRGSQLVGDQAISRGEFDRLTAQYRRNQRWSISSRPRWRRRASRRRSAAPLVSVRSTSAIFLPAVR